MPTKNTNTNNNIIQILLENKKSKRRKTNNRKEQGQPSKPVNYIKDNEMQTRPLNLVNSMASSSRLEDQARVRFMDAMRDPFSTKSPYSIYDNGSNTFARQGETVGAEVPVSSQLRPDDYFEEPIRQSARQFSSPRRFDINDDVSVISSRNSTGYDDENISDEGTYGSNSYNLSDISDVSEMSGFPFPLRKVRQGSVNSFPGIPLYKSTDESRYDDWVDPTQQGEQENEEDKFGISGTQYFQPDQTRFSERVEPPPAFATPYRPQAESEIEGLSGLKEKVGERKKILDSSREKLETQEMGREDIDMKLYNQEQAIRERREEDVDMLLKNQEQAIRERMEEDKRDAERIESKKLIRKQFQKIISALEKYRDSGVKDITDVGPRIDANGNPIFSKRGSPVKTGTAFRSTMMDLLRDDKFKEYTGQKNNIRTMTRTTTLLEYFNKISTKITEDIKANEAINAQKRKDRKKLPTTSGIEQEFIKVGDDRGIAGKDRARF